jgi:hypothetical protein
MNSEAYIQHEAVEWFRNEFAPQFDPAPIIAQVRNENSQAHINTGLLPGHSDLVIYSQPFGVLFVETKTPQAKEYSYELQKHAVPHFLCVNGYIVPLDKRLSLKQAEFALRVQNLGFPYAMFDSLEGFQRIVHQNFENDCESGVTLPIQEFGAAFETPPATKNEI